MTLENPRSHPPRPLGCWTPQLDAHYAGMTTNQIAADLRAHPSSVRRWRSGRARIDWDRIGVMVLATKLPITAFFPDTGPIVMRELPPPHLDVKPEPGFAVSTRQDTSLHLSDFQSRTMADLTPTQPSPALPDLDVSSPDAQEVSGPDQTHAVSDAQFVPKAQVNSGIELAGSVSTSEQALLLTDTLPLMHDASSIDQAETTEQSFAPLAVKTTPNTLVKPKVANTTLLQTPAVDETVSEPFVATKQDQGFVPLASAEDQVLAVQDVQDGAGKVEAVSLDAASSENLAEVEAKGFASEDVVAVIAINTALDDADHVAAQQSAPAVSVWDDSLAAMLDTLPAAAPETQEIDQPIHEVLAAQGNAEPSKVVKHPLEAADVLSDEPVLIVQDVAPEPIVAPVVASDVMEPAPDLVEPLPEPGSATDVLDEADISEPDVFEPMVHAKATAGTKSSASLADMLDSLAKQQTETKFSRPAAVSLRMTSSKTFSTLMSGPVGVARSCRWPMWGDQEKTPKSPVYCEAALANPTNHSCPPYCANHLRAARQVRRAA